MKYIFKTPTDVGDIIYAASMMDGEGSFTIDLTTPGAPTGVVKAEVKMTKPEVIRWFSETFGGPCTPYKNSYGFVYTWRISGHAAVAFTKLVKPYLKLKEKQATVILAFGETMRPHGGKGMKRSLDEAVILYRLRLADVLKELNARQTKLVSQEVE